MAAIERITLESVPLSQTLTAFHETISAMPGLRINIRATTSSFSDYSDWNLDELRTGKMPVITDGTCS